MDGNSNVNLQYCISAELLVDRFSKFFKN